MLLLLFTNISGKDFSLIIWMLPIHWLLVVGCWLLVVGCWMLDVGCWLLVVVWLVCLCLLLLYFMSYNRCLIFFNFGILTLSVAVVLRNDWLKRLRQSPLSIMALLYLLLTRLSRSWLCHFWVIFRTHHLLSDLVIILFIILFFRCFGQHSFLYLLQHYQ